MSSDATAPASAKENPGDRESNEIEIGQQVYTPRFLAMYDFLILTVIGGMIWRCPRKKLLNLYKEHMTENHLDCGVGTGFFVDQCATTEAPRFGLIDLNHNSLASASQKLSRFNPVIFRKNILNELNLDCRPFDSVAMNYLLHCVPGDLSTKSRAFDRILPYLNDGGTLFGATVLGTGVKIPWLATQAMRLFNHRGIFSNRNDSLSELEEQLSQRFETVNVEMSGCVALFWASGARGKLASDDPK